MRTVLILPLFLLTFTGLFSAKAALPDARGLQISLVTGQSRFEIPLAAASGSTATTPLQKDWFTASVALTNRGRSPVLLTYPEQSGGEVFKVTLLDASGGVAWTSETSGVESDSAPEQFVLAGRVTLRRTVRVPLKTSEGQWLAAGRYTLRAETGLGEALAQVPIDIVGTGIRGQVFFQDFTLGPALPPEEGRIGIGWTRSDPVPIQATVYIWEIREPNAKYDHPQFVWSGLTDNEGHFNVLTPAGRFSIRAHANNVVEPAHIVAPPPLIVSVTAGQFSTQNMTIEGWLAVPKSLIDSVMSATVEPLGDPVVALRITARGQVPSSGWTFPQLVRRESTQAGVIEFDFKAVPPPPNSPAFWAFMPINAVAVTVIHGPWTTVRVTAQNGTITATPVTTPQP